MKNKNFILPFHKAHITDDEIEAVSKVLKSGWLTMGPTTIEFEEKFQNHIKSNFALSLNSATAALHLALKAIGLSEKDEVIVPTNTFIATAEVVTYFNAIPVLCDIEYDTHNIDVSKIESLITQKTKAIIPVHFGGQPCDMDEIYEIAKKYNLAVIEDAAHALPSYYKGQMIGSLKYTDITCFSFYATKTITTGEGGMATTNNELFANNMKINRLHGISKDVWDRYSNNSQGWYYEVIDNGNKYNTTDINSALGLIQLDKMYKMNQKRKKIAQLYDSAFKNNDIEVLFNKEDRESSFHLYVIKINNRDELYNVLKEKGISTSVHFIPIHKHPYYQSKFNYKNEDYPVANDVFGKNLSLPIYPDMTEEEIEYVIGNVLKYANK